MICLVVGCGSKPGSNIPGGPSGVLTSEAIQVFDEEDAADLFSDSVDYPTGTGSPEFGIIAQVTSSASSNLLSPFQAFLEAPRTLSQPFQLCVPSTSGNITDGDADNVPISADLTYQCPLSSGLLPPLVGSVHIEDDDDQIPRPQAGFLIKTNALTIEQSTKKINIKGFIDVDVTPANRTFVANLSVISLLQNGNSREFNIWIKTIVTPADASNPRASGLVSFENSYLGIKAATINVVVAISSENLTYDHTCAKRFKNGKITLTDGAGNVLQLIFQNCQVTRLLNGNPV